MLKPVELGSVDASSRPRGPPADNEDPWGGERRGGLRGLEVFDIHELRSAHGALPVSV